MYDILSYSMTTQEEKIRVNARIPKSLYDWVNSEYDNTSQAIIKPYLKTIPSLNSIVKTHNLLNHRQDLITYYVNIAQTHVRQHTTGK